MLSIELSNIFHPTDEELQRTNNSTEDWHRRSQGYLPSCHFNFWKFLHVLKGGGSVISVNILQQFGSHIDPPRRARYVDCKTQRHVV